MFPKNANALYFFLLFFKKQVYYTSFLNTWKKTTVDQNEMLHSIDHGY